MKDSVWDAIINNPKESADLKARAALMRAVVHRFTASGQTPVDFATSIDYPLPVMTSLLNGEIDQFNNQKLIDMLLKSGMSLDAIAQNVITSERKYTRAEIAQWRADAFLASAQIAARYGREDVASYIRRLANEETTAMDSGEMELAFTRRYAINYAADAFGLYKVVSGDTLSAIGRRFSVAWEHLAELNNLQNPDLIYPDQIIKLR